MPDASDRRNHGRGLVRADREAQGVPGGPLRAEPHGEGRHHDVESPQAQGGAVRVGANQHVPGRCEHPAGRRHRQAFVGRTHTLEDPERQAQACVRADQRMARPAIDAGVPVPVRGRRVWHKRTRGGSVETVSVPVAVGVNDTDHWEAVGVTEGMKEAKTSWEVHPFADRTRAQGRAAHGRRPVRRVVATVNAMLPEARCQRCVVHFMRNVPGRVSDNDTFSNIKGTIRWTVWEYKASELQQTFHCHFLLGV